MPLNAPTRPKESESIVIEDGDERAVSVEDKLGVRYVQLPHDQAPIIIPVKMELERVPIHRSDMPNSSVHAFQSDELMPANYSP